MEKYCINHSEEKAVGICGACGAPTCYRCSMSVDQIVYCSLECFNQLNANSSPQVPRQPTAPAEADASQVNPAFADEYSDVMQSMGGVPSHPAPPVPDLDAPTYLEEESVVLGAPQADESVVLTPPPGDESVVLSASQAEDSTMLGMSPPIPRAFDTSTLVIIPGTRRSVLSSSCFFHPDTSAIVLCADCRNPICSLCARETSAGLTCSPSCGPADPAGAYLRRTSLLFSVAVAAGIFVFVAGGFYLVRETRSKLASGAVLAQAGADAAAAAERSGPPPPEEIPAPVVPPEEKPEVAPPPAPAPPDPAPLEFKPLTRPAPLRLNPPEPPPVEPVVPEFLPAAPSAVVAPQPPAPAAPVVPQSPPLTAFELDMRWAASLLREAVPLLNEVAEQLTPDWQPGPNTHVLSAKLSRAILKLRQARELYRRRFLEAPDKGLIEDRMSTIADGLKAAQTGLERLGGVPQWRR